MGPGSLLRHCAAVWARPRPRVTRASQGCPVRPSCLKRGSRERYSLALEMTSTATTDAPAAGLESGGVARWISGKALLAVLFWGSSFVAIRIALEGLHPFALVATRLALGAVLLYAVLGVRREALLPRREDLGVCVSLGILLGGHLLLQSFAMRWTTAMRAGWLVAFVPVTIALGARFFLGHQLRAVGWLGVATASCGVLLLTSTAPSEFARAGTGDMMMLSSSVSWAAYTLISLRPVERNGALRVTAFAMAIAVVPNA